MYVAVDEMVRGDRGLGQDLTGMMGDNGEGPQHGNR